MNKTYVYLHCLLIERWLACMLSLALYTFYSSDQLGRRHQLTATIANYTVISRWQCDYQLLS